MLWPASHLAGPSERRKAAPILSQTCSIPFNSQSRRRQSSLNKKAARGSTEKPSTFYPPDDSAQAGCSKIENSSKNRIAASQSFRDIGDFSRWKLKNARSSRIACRRIRAPLDDSAAELDPGSCVHSPFRKGPSGSRKPQAFEFAFTRLHSLSLSIHRTRIEQSELSDPGGCK